MKQFNNGRDFLQYSKTFIRKNIFPQSNTSFKNEFNSEKGYILPSVLLIGFLVISMLFSVFIIVSFNFQLDIKRYNKKKLDLACYSAVQKHLRYSKLNIASGSYIADVDSLPVLVTYGMKGLFYTIQAEAKKGQDSSKTVFSYNRLPNPEFENALIISKVDVIPSVAGETRITGNILSSSNRVNIGTIFGLKNTDANYLDGKVMASKEIKTKLFADTLVKNIFAFVPDGSFARVEGNRSLSPGELDTLQNIIIEGDVHINGLSNSRTNYTNLKIKVGGKLFIKEGTELKREMEIYCDSAVEIGRNVKLENTMIVTRSGITVGQGSELQYVQLFTTKSIKSDQAYFKFPSVLCLYIETTNKKNYRNQMELKSTTLNGSALLVCDITGLSGNQSKIIIDEKSVVHGMIYSENYAEIHGEINGSVYVNSLWYYKEPTQYLNWMIDLNINRKKLDPEFLLPVGFSDEQKYKLVREVWIY